MGYITKPGTGNPRDLGRRVGPPSNTLETKEMGNASRAAGSILRKKFPTIHGPSDVHGKSSFCLFYLQQFERDFGHVPRPGY